MPQTLDSTYATCMPTPALDDESKRPVPSTEVGSFDWEVVESEDIREAAATASESTDGRGSAIVSTQGTAAPKKSKERAAAEEAANNAQDANLARALALSLEPHADSGGSGGGETNGDADLAAALALSLEPLEPSEPLNLDGNLDGKGDDDDDANRSSARLLLQQTATVRKEENMRLLHEWSHRVCTVCVCCGVLTLAPSS